jgi:hypothetical protein
MGLSDHSIHAWLQEHKVKTETGVKLDFKDHLFMFDVYSDESPFIVCEKAAQITFSTMAIIKKFWMSKKRKLDIIYTLPSASDIKDFVGAKVNRIIQQNQILQDYVSDKDTIEQKRVGESIIYYRGTWTDRAAIAVSADLTIFDEVDRSNMPVVEQYASRLQHSAYGGEWYFSNPSYEGNGVDKYWPDSDQKHWFITCNSCGKEQFLEWPHNICQERKVFQCKFCHEELSHNERRIGRWRKKKSQNDPKFSGYWISLLMAPWVPAEKILQLKKDKDEAYFDNFVRGKPHIGSDNKVQYKTIMQNLSSEVNDQSGRIVIGCDTGLGIHLVAGNEQGIFYYNTSGNYDEFESLMHRFPRAIAVFDAHGDLQKPRELQMKYPGRIFLCYYIPDRKTGQLVTWGNNDNAGTVKVDRNRMIQLVIDEFRGKRVTLFGTENDYYDFWTHFKAIYRKEELNSLGVMKRIWERSGPDHLVHAAVYWRTGMDRFGFGGGETVGKQSTIQGFKNSYEVNYDGTVKASDVKTADIRNLREK